MKAPAVPTLWLLLESSADRNHCQKLLAIEPVWSGQVFSGSRPESLLASSNDRETGGDFEKWPDVVVLDRSNSTILSPALQPRWETAPPAILWLLDDSDHNPLPKHRQTDICDYLFKSQLNETRLKLTLRNLWRQQQQQQQLEDCYQWGKVFRQAEVGINLTERAKLATAQQAVEFDDRRQVTKAIGISQDVTEVRAAEEALRRSEQKHRALVEALPDLIIHMSGDGVYLDFFAASNMKVIEDINTLIGQGIYDQGMPHELAEMRMGYIRQALATGELQFYEQTLVNGEETVTEEVRVVPAGDNEVLIIVRDITERARLEAERQQAENEQKASERRYAILTESAPVGIFCFDAAGQLVYVNPCWCEMTGYTLEAAVGDGWITVLHPDDRDRLLNIWAEALARPIPYRTEGRIIHPDGRVLWFDLRKVPEFDEEGQLLGFVGTVSDITRNKEAETALRQANQQMEAVFSAFPDLLFQLQADGTIQDHKARSNEDLYVSPNHFIGQKVQDILPPEAGQQIYQAMQQALKSGSVVSVEYQLPVADQVKFFDARIVALDETNLISLARDISDRKLAETALQASEERLRTAMAAAKMGSWNWHLETERVVWSESLERLMGLEPGTFDGQIETVTAMIHPEDQQRVADAITRSLERGENYDIEFRFVKPDGRVRWAAGKGDVIRNADGQVIGMAGVDIDITDRKLAETQVKEVTQRLKLAADSAGIGIWDYNLSEQQLIWDDRMYALYGLPATSTKTPYDTWEHNVHPDDRDRAAAELQAAIQGKQDFHTEFRVLWPDGQVRFIEAHAMVLRNAEGIVQRMIGVNWDITDRKQAELALRQLNEELEQRIHERTKALARSERDLRTIFNNVYDAIYIHDLNGKILDVNDRTLELHGATREQLMGASVSELSGLGAPVGDIAEIFQQAQAGQSLEFEWVGRRLNDGSSFDVEVSLRRVILEEQSVIIAGARDITDRKQADIAIRDSEARFRAAFEQAAVGIVQADLDGRLVQINQKFCDILGYDSDEDLYLKHFSEITYSDDLAADQFQVNRLLAGKASNFVIEKRYYRQDGTVVWANLSVSLVRTIDGDPSSFIAVIQDITDRKWAEEALHDSEERLRLALMATNQGMYDLDLNTGDTVVSPTYITMLGYNPANFHETNAKLMQRLHPEDREEIGNIFRAYIAGQIPNYKVEFRQRTQDGFYKWILSVGKIVEWDEHGRPLRLIGTHTDIHDRKQAEAALRESEERFRQIANNISEVFWLATPNHEILYASPAYEQIWGLSADAINAEAWLETVHPADRERLSQVNETLPQYPFGLLRDNRELEYRIIRPDGEVRWIRDRAFPVYDDQGQIYRIAGVAEDITERKRLQQEQHRLLSVLEASPDHIGMAHSDGTLIWTNQQAKQLRGLPPDTDVTQLSLNIFHPQWAQAVIQQEAIPKALKGDIWMGETALLTADGKEFPVSQLMWANRSETGEVEYVSTIMRDISDLKRAEQALRDANADLETRVTKRTAELIEARDAAENANQAKSIFLANMSHELRTPLNAILGFSQLMGRDQTLSNKHLEELKIINRSGEHLLTLINDILEMSKIEAGQATLNPEQFNLSLLLNNLVDMLRLKAESKGLSFSLASHAELPQYIGTDSHKLRQVLLNLLSNAIKFTQIGYVVLRVVPADLADLDPTQLSHSKLTEEASSLVALRFEIEDSGVGIAPEELDLLFEPFVQTSSGRLSQEGTGLGLPISYQFVQLMGGNLTVISQPGAGSMFAFTIPVQVVDAAAIEPSEVQRRVIGMPPDQPEYRILIAEDNWANRILLQNLLTDLGFTVKTAVNGQEAVNCWQSWRPHLIFMDIRMPLMNGCEATQAIRHREQLRQGQHDKTSATKIISLTAGVFEDAQADFDQVGFDDFMRKPIQESDITRTIARHLAVEYLYEAEVPMAEESSNASISDLSTEILKTLPADWLAQFHQALIQLNQVQMLTLIETLPPEQAPIAGALHRKVHDFDFEPLLDLLQNTDNS